MDLRFDVVRLLKEAVRERDMAELAASYGVCISKDGKINKGWVGQTLDRLTKTKDLSASKPDGPDFELKSVHVIPGRHGGWAPKETVAITMFNPKTIISETFEDSALWHKLSRLILVGHHYVGGNKASARVQFICPIDVSDPALKDAIRSFWEEIRETTINGKIAKYSSKGTSSGFVQLRTKGSGTTQSTCPMTSERFNSRAFYATKGFVRYVCGLL